MNSPRRQTSSGALAQSVLLHELQSLCALLLPRALESGQQQSTQGLASPRLIRSGVRVEFERAWALLQALMTAPMSWPTDAPHAQDHCAEEALLQAYFAAAPQLSEWDAYLSQFPPGDKLSTYREERRQSLWQWLPHVHPTHAMLRHYAGGMPSSPLCTGITAHVDGPYVCASCRRLLAAAQRPDNRSDWAPAERLAAASPTSELEWSTHLIAAGGTRLPCMVRWIDDRGFLRVFIGLAGDARPILPLMVVACFETGAVLRTVVQSADSIEDGINFGPLGSLSLQQFTGFYLCS